MIEMNSIYPKFQQKLIERPSEHWLKEFLDRWKLNTLKSSDIELLRSKQATTSSIKKWFSEVYEKIDFNLYEKDLIGNKDET